MIREYQTMASGRANAGNTTSTFYQCSGRANACVVLPELDQSTDGECYFCTN